MIGRGIGDAYIVFLLPLTSEFGWSRAESTSVFSIYLLVTGLAAPLTGLLFDRWGPRLVYPLGVACLGTCCLLAPSLTRLWQFQLVVGVLCGVGVSALGMVPASSLISRWFRANISTAMAIVYAGFGSGALVIVPFVQYVIETHGWRRAYYLLGGGVVALLPLVLLLPWGALAKGPPERFARTSAAPESRAIRPLRSVLGTRAYWLLVQVFFFTSLGMYTIIVQTVALLVDIGFAPMEAAGAFGVGGLLSVVGMTASGWFSDRIGYRPTATASFAGTFVGITLLAALSYHAAHGLLLGFVLTFGVCQGARGPIVASLCARLFPGPGFATIYGTIFATASLGAALGSWTSGVLHDLTGGYRASLAFSMVCVLLAVAPFWFSDILALRRRSE
jgi:MFS family permease